MISRTALIRSRALHGGWLLASLWVFSASAQALRVPADYLRQIDGDGDGRVSLAEYQQWMRYGFDAMDRNADGVLAPEELPGGRGQRLTLAGHLANIEAVFRRQDRNADGYLDVRELAAPPRAPSGK